MNLVCQECHHHHCGAKISKIIFSLKTLDKFLDMIIVSSDSITSNMSQHQKMIAPKTSNNFGGRNNSATMTGSETVSSSTSANHRQTSSASCRRRIAFHPTLGYAITPTVPPKVARRNARERNRVKQVNCGFEMLRSHIPSAAKAKKMSKVDTLRHAVEYIQTMQKMLHEQHHQQQQMQLPETLHIQPPLTPTPSSRASSIPSPMTPHLLQNHSHHQQQHHFILPEVPTYPSPLTPRTPNTPASTEFNQMSGNHFPSNDSGYDTSSFYSASSPSIMSPGVGGNCHQVRPSHLLQHPQHLVPNHHLESPISPPMFSQSNQFQVLEAAGQQFHYGDFVGIAKNLEEEELLDAIAKWQEQEDE